tara:strand:- start:47 stop:457 length:411 start_codon:yes stop_codon:yes gene_type:complete
MTNNGIFRCEACGAMPGQEHSPGCSYLTSVTITPDMLKVDDRVLNKPTTKVEDTGAHYRWSFRLKLTDEDIARGFVDVKLDPYRICKTVGMEGGPREHACKKLLRGTSKGCTERRLIKEVRDALDRWEEMLEEEGQ